MPRDDEPLLELAAWAPALEKYGAVVTLTVELYDSAGSLVCGPVFPTPLFELVESNGSPGEFAECASRCLAQTGDEVVLHADDGITILGNLCTS